MYLSQYRVGCQAGLCLHIVTNLQCTAAAVEAKLVEAAKVAAKEVEETEDETGETMGGSLAKGGIQGVLKE